jgi:hypothetical protein
MMVIVMLGFTQQVTFADNFSCGDLNNNHCYALDRWYIGPPDYGSFTEEQVVNLSCTCNNIIGGETGFINNEVWVSQDSNSACGGNVCWVEAGYSDSGGIGAHSITSGLISVQTVAIMGMTSTAYRLVI